MGNKTSACPCIFFKPAITLINIIAKIGPHDAIPTRPKLSSSDILPLFNWETPSPRAKIKGVVIAPVVAPEASTEMSRNSSEVIIPIKNIIKYTKVYTLFKGFSNKILSKPTATIIPTPIETTISIEVEDNTPPEASLT